MYDRNLDRPPTRSVRLASSSNRRDPRRDCGESMGRYAQTPLRTTSNGYDLRRLTDEGAPRDGRGLQERRIPLGVNERRRGQGSPHPGITSRNGYGPDTFRQGSNRRAPSAIHEAQGPGGRIPSEKSRSRGTGRDGRPSGFAPRSPRTPGLNRVRSSLGRPRHRNSYTHVRSNRIFTRSSWLERLMRTPVIVIVLAIALLGGGGFAIHFANQQRAAEEAAQAEAAAEKKRLAAQKVNPLRLGIGAYPVSTPRSEWKQGTMPHLYQTDPAWAQLPYAGGTVENNACGPTSLTMVYVYLTGRTDLDPGDMAAFADQNNFAPTGATEWSFMTMGASMLGLNSTALPITRNAITQALANGSPVICSVLPGDFTAVGHYIVLKSIDDRGMVEVFDPNSPYNSARRWDIQRILTQTRNCWSFWV